MDRPYSDKELSELIAELKAWISFPIKELSKQTDLSRATISNWYNKKGNIQADNKMLLWHASMQLLIEKKQAFDQQKNGGFSKDQL